MNAEYEIGGVPVTMSVAAAKRWNSGTATRTDLRRSVVSISDTRSITLRRALNHRLEPEIAAMIEGMPANRVSSFDSFDS